MSYNPVIPIGGFAGWKFLQRTEIAQRAAHSASGPIKRDLEYFATNIAKVKNADQLVNDYRLLSVALAAFGLENDTRNKYFIKKVMEGGSIDPNSLANKLSDKRYLELSKAFGFGDFNTPNTILSTFPKSITDRFKDRSFETSVGKVNDSMRLALNAKRELSALADRKSSDTTKWFILMGTPPLRTVMEGALNMPASFALMPLDRQLEMFKDRSAKFFGNSELSQFTDPDAMENLIRRFLITREVSQYSSRSSGATIALQLIKR